MYLHPRAGNASSWVLPHVICQISFRKHFRIGLGLGSTRTSMLGYTIWINWVSEYNYNQYVEIVLVNDLVGWENEFQI